jgi:hypothetical protein
MIDLRILRDRWTEDGARNIFAQLVTQCVKAIYPMAGAIRPDPGDEGIDTFVGEFEGGRLQVYQAKYFCDRIGDSQKTQIRKSWATCKESDHFSKVGMWTLCIPIEMSVEETKWWQKWRKQESRKTGRQIELWPLSKFTGFHTRPDLAKIFDVALERGHTFNDIESLKAAMVVAQTTIKSLPHSGFYTDAIFVRKLEAAGIFQHRSARTAFYNFELVRQTVSQGGSSRELELLEDLQERILDVWESEFNARDPAQLGRQFIAAVYQRIEQECDGLLRCVLPVQAIHKKGGLHYWADNCEAGWTKDFKDIGRENGSK